ncbi:hypothetical protein SLEP1_g3920 [Rubroshorea leprosula]|uniref:Uncharacterized protein n=1 Tax=Rubroshorea leprosula TaxID=152421 RepID=A0AAV5HWE7_9ROSI|nr:hypothetical protein SLEP1_g3920 [Rubroshorea leprosula]
MMIGGMRVAGAGSDGFVPERALPLRSPEQLGGVGWTLNLLLFSVVYSNWLVVFQEGIGIACCILALGSFLPSDVNDIVVF